MSETGSSTAQLKKDIEGLKDAVAKLIADAKEEGRTRGRNANAAVSDKAAEIGHALGEQGRKSAAAIEKTVQNRPVQSLLIAFGVGVLVSQLLRRQR